MMKGVVVKGMMVKGMMVKEMGVKVEMVECRVSRTCSFMRYSSFHKHHHSIIYIVLSQLLARYLTTHRYLPSIYPYASMSSRAITYVWKFKRPKDEKKVRALIAAAYQTAITMDTCPTKILIRYYITVNSTVEHSC